MVGIGLTELVVIGVIGFVVIAVPVAVVVAVVMLTRKRDSGSGPGQ